MKNKFLIAIIIILILIVVAYLFVKKPPVQTPTIQDQTQIEDSSADTEAITEEMMNGTEGMTAEEIMNMMNQGQASADETTAKNIVNYTNNGFSPSSLEIKVGKTVQFVNQSSGGMWVASGNHPSHSIYPEFDAKKNIPSGGSYEFTFTKVGEWKYHNHLKASAFGTIIVK